MRRMILLVASLILAIGVLACSKSENTSTGNSNSATAQKPASAEKPATSTTSIAASSSDKIGVPECDDFIAKYESCTSKVPEMAREQYKSAMTQWKASWKKLAESPQTKGQLAAACKQAADQQAAAWKMYGCAQ